MIAEFLKRRYRITVEEVKLTVDLANEMDISNMEYQYDELDEELWKRYYKLYNKEGKFN